MRLDKYICKSTDLSRLEATNLIQLGKVKVNGEVLTLEMSQVHQSNQVELENKPIFPRAFQYLMMNKLAGLVCSNVDEIYPSIFNNINLEDKENLHIAGRLDVDSTGLVLITDDGRWTYNITSPSTECPKVYRVSLKKALSNGAIEQLKKGILLQGESKPTLPAALTIISEKKVLLTIYEGKFHQVKRMFSAVGNRVTTLHRQSIGGLTLDLEPGSWRHLEFDEIAMFSLDTTKA